jgi:hypothetical protein
MNSVKSVQEAFSDFHYWVRQPMFQKGRQFHSFKESELLPLIRFFLLGHFRMAVPEHRTKVEILPDPEGTGYFDFFVPGAVIEVATRAPGEGKSKLTAYTNRSERRKLAQRSTHWTVKSGVLVLLDFTATPLEDEILEEYRSRKHIGAPGAPLRNFSVLYYYPEIDDSTWCIRKNIRF